MTFQKRKFWPLNTLGIVCFHLNLQPYHQSLLAEYLSKPQKKIQLSLAAHNFSNTTGTILPIDFNLLN